MGNCCQVDTITKEVDQQLAKEKQIEKSTTKILFLGAGSGGKSTIFKQLGCIYNHNDNATFDDEMKRKVYTQITEHFKSALTLWKEEKSDNNAEMDESIRIVQTHKDLSEFPETLANAIQYIWENNTILKQSIQSMKFKHRIIEETTVYYWDDLDRIKQVNYVPNQLDFLHLSNKTTGIIQRWLTINDRRFHMFDVGGQVSERKKWINHFDNCTALLFVVDLNSFDQTMFENRDKNCMVDSMQIFEDVCNNPIFDHTHIILFFNKRDLFAQKIENVEITECSAFEDFCEFEHGKYKNKNDFDECTAYISAKFNVLNKSENIIYSHLTCAMEKDNIQNVFDDVRNIVLMQNTKKIVPN